MPRVHDDFDCTNADSVYAGSSKPDDRMRGNGVERFEVRTLGGDVGSSYTAVENEGAFMGVGSGGKRFPMKECKLRVVRSCERSITLEWVVQ